MIDLHSHSKASDGQYSPSELICKAAAENISVLALTDHDTVAGHAEALEASKKAGIIFVPGTELEIQWPTGEFHLLGLGLKSLSEKLMDIISFLQNGRKSRNGKIIEKMQQDGIQITLEQLEELNPGKSLGRPHIADFLVSKKIVKNRQSAFDKFLARGRPWYVSRAGADLKEAVQAISDSGGIPVIAHPLSLYVSWGKLDGVLSEIFAAGVQGLEAWHPGARVVESRRLEELGRKIGFFITAGSDFHGEKIRADRKLGHSAGGRKIEDRFWTEELLPRLSE